jgi:diguanylate cyclase (GGDEF)-like protein
MIDIDHFKNINDQYGHLVGDVILKQVAQIIKKNVRELDLVGRYGGEEFGVLLIETDDSGALYVAERIRAAVAEKEFKAYDESLRVTLSIGCSTLSDKARDVASLIETADAALYKAKHEGRNKVMSAGPVPPQRHNKKG